MLESVQFMLADLFSTLQGRLQHPHPHSTFPAGTMYSPVNAHNELEYLLPCVTEQLQEEHEG